MWCTRVPSLGLFSKTELFGARRVEKKCILTALIRLAELSSVLSILSQRENWKHDCNRKSTCDRIKSSHNVPPRIGKIRKVRKNEHWAEVFWLTVDGRNTPKSPSVGVLKEHRFLFAELIFLKSHPKVKTINWGFCRRSEAGNLKGLWISRYVNLMSTF